jgi:uncharacterized membrane protein YphA (DoxX/SURF4 family)
MSSEKATSTATAATGASSIQIGALALMRMAIGWHFAYEGWVKWIDPEWTSAGFLQASSGPLSGFFQWILADPTRLAVVDQLNIWGLLLIGVALMLGLLTRFAALMGILLLAMYYLAFPPLFMQQPPMPVEGHYLLVNKTLVELLALLVVLAWPARLFGLDGIITGLASSPDKPTRTGEKTAESTPTHGEAVATSMTLSRRGVLAGLAGLPVVGAFVLAIFRKHGYESVEHRQLAEKLGGGAGQPPGKAAAEVDGVSGATIHRFEWTEIDKLKGKPPMAKIKDLELSRLMLGGNLIGGWAHARDLIYVDKLVKAYHNEQRIFETFQLAEQCGVNAIITNPILCETIVRYWEKTGGKMKFISDCGGKDMREMVKKSIDAGAAACYVHGGMADGWAKAGQFDRFAEILELIREYNVPAGIGCHLLPTLQGCVDAGIQPDFWMKTLHKTTYWSATEVREHDNIWSETPEETIEYMKGRDEPWIAFKTMAAGALKPKEAFQYAFENGADFVCAGMYDFQIVEDVNLAHEVFQSDLKRDRPWKA